MAAEDASLAALSPVVQAFMHSQRIGASAVRADGRLVITVDRRWRVHVRNAPHSRVALQTELIALPDEEGGRIDDALLRLAKSAAGLLRQHASTLCIDRQRQTLVLQQLVGAGADLGTFQDALADFASALAFWSSVCRPEAQALLGVTA